MSTTTTSSTRVWLITGCSTGIGRSLAEAVLEHGERLVATLRSPSALQQLSEKYPSSQLLILPLDVTVRSQIDDVFAKAKQHFGQLDVVVNNAGYAIEGEVESIPEEEARVQLEVLFWGAVSVTKKAVTFFREENPQGVGGRILQVSSVGGFNGQPTLAYYSAGKFALEGFTEGFSKELPLSWNIKMTLIELGGFRTNFRKPTSMVKVPIHPSYADPSTPTSMRRKFLETYKEANDPSKAAQAMIDISKDQDPPMRLVLGPEALNFIRRELISIGNELDKYEHVSNAMIADGDETDVTALNKAIK